MTREELTDWWRLYVRTLAGLLEAAEGAPGAQPPPNVLQQVQQLQREALFLHIRCARALARARPAAGCPVRSQQCCRACFANLACAMAAHLQCPLPTALAWHRAVWWAGAGIAWAWCVVVWQSVAEQPHPSGAWRRAAVTNATSVKHFVANGVVDPAANVPEAPCTPAAWWPVRTPGPAAAATDCYHTARGLLRLWQ